MCDAIGHPVRRLVRTRIGPLADRQLAPGEWRPLTARRSPRAVTAALGNGPGPRGHPAVTSSPVRLLALRGAITCDEDTKAEIEAKTQRLVKEMLARNDLAHDDVVSIIFTATDDLTAEFPAVGVRALGLDDVPLLGAQEQAVDGGMPRCVRVLVHCYTRAAPRRAAPRVPRRRGCLRADLPD